MPVFGVTYKIYYNNGIDFLLFVFNHVRYFIDDTSHKTRQKESTLGNIWSESYTQMTNNWVKKL